MRSKSERYGCVLAMRVDFLVWFKKISAILIFDKGYWVFQLLKNWVRAYTFPAENVKNIKFSNLKYDEIIMEN